MTLAEMRGRMSSREFASWLAFDRLQPVGDRRADLHFAHLSALVESAMSGKQVQVSKYDHFADTRLPRPGRRPKPGRSVDAQKRQAIKLTRLLGGTVTGVSSGDNRKT